MFTGIVEELGTVAAIERGVESAVVHYGDITMTFLNNWFRTDRQGTSLQYASASGSGWDFNKQPLGGTSTRFALIGQLTAGLKYQAKVATLRAGADALSCAGAGRCAPFSYR